MTEVRAPDTGPTPFTDPIAPLRDQLRVHYEILRQIGQGAFATVYLAKDLKHERKVAIKVLNADPTSETGELRFIREIRTIARLQHPNILPLHDSGHVEALLYYVMPYVEGETLRDRIDREKQLPIDVACTIAREAADALAYAHGQGIIHRDIKPENILLSAGHPIIADFGIARVIDLAGVRQLTRTGMGSPGTPAYMSPEQLLGDRAIDGRSDTYSLGCVLYEMLTGKPPFAGKEGFVKRFTEPPPSIASIRRDLPHWIDEVVAKCLARDPNARYQTAQEFVAALSANEDRTFARVVAESGQSLASSQPEPKTVGPIRPRTRSERPFPLAPGAVGGSVTIDRHLAFRALPKVSRRRYATAGLGLLVLLLGGVYLFRNSEAGFAAVIGLSPKIDSTRLAVIPFGGSGQLAQRNQLTHALYAALSEWRDLKLSGNQDFAGGAAVSVAPETVRAAAAIARRAGAARFIWGQVNAETPGQGRAQLYDISSELPLKSVRITIGDDAQLARAANDLLQPPGRPPTADGGDGRTTSHAAWNAYALAHIAALNGNLTAAEQDFREAIKADPDFAPARVWLAQTLEWKAPAARQDWREAAVQGLRAKSGLADKDHAIAVALMQMADNRYPEACAGYEQLVAADSLDFTGWYGLGQCKAFDSLVVRSASSRSGWRFRSRYSDAADAYMKALNINPNAHSILSFDQLQDLLPTAASKTRRGRGADDEEFAAFPGLINDTVVFVPYPLPQFSALVSKEIDRLKAAALARDLDVLLDFTTDWARRSPQSASAFLALSDILEARGELTQTRSAGISAMEAIEKARRVAVNPHDALLGGAGEAWLLFKQGEFTRARVLSDSLLAAARTPDASTAQALIGLAALTGKIGKMSELARLIPAYYAAGTASAPVSVMDAAASYFAFAALGVCADTILFVERHLDEQITHFVAEDERDRVTLAIKGRPRSMLGPCTAGRSSLGLPASATRLLRMQQALATNNNVALRGMLATVADQSRAQRPGDISLDLTYQLSWLSAAVGDTAQAVQQLDRALGSLPSLSGLSIREPAAAAAAGRSMAFRADLAAARGEADERKRWAQALVDLWATADAPLQPRVMKMRSLIAPLSPK
jgi:serine/threonine protein kinase/tetratricopeptide (TPR) repeat protein